MNKVIKKIARICCNEDYWEMPSKRGIKSKDRNSYEGMYGFGHEEWLFDFSKDINGYHYAFLQPINTTSHKHSKNTYQIHLYFIDSKKQRMYIGYIDNVCCLTKDEAEYAIKIYKKENWLDEMKQQVKAIGGNVSVFEKEGKTPINVFNIKFRKEDLRILKPQYYIRIPSNKWCRYVLMDFDENSLEENTIRKTIHKYGKTYLNDSHYFITYSTNKEIEVCVKHKIIQRGVRQYLLSTKEYIPKNVIYEYEFIDVSAIRNDGHVELYEIKTYEEPKRCIREALGQVLEYNHFALKDSSKDLYIVGPNPLDDQLREYMDSLRTMYGIPVWYRWYSKRDGVLHEKE